MVKQQRASGILMHITSLPSPFGIGGLGQEAYDFADRLEKAGQKYWQILPLNPTETGTGNSPYSSTSAFAGNTLLISPQKLVDDGYLTEKDIARPPAFTEEKVDFKKVAKYKQRLLEKAFSNFSKQDAPEDFQQFIEQQKHWLDDYALFMAIRKDQKESDWSKWPKGLRNRKIKDIKKGKEALAEEIRKQQFLQYQFFKQWGELKQYCNQHGISIIGDMPFYVDYSSADVWTNTSIFKLNKDKKLTAVSGVPPDYFSEDGQLWGNPVYNFKKLKSTGYKWWLDRIEQNMQFFDLLRLDHFRAFSEYWEVAADAKTAINGKYKPGPAYDLFNLLEYRFPMMPFIAEDLGDIDQPVHDLMDEYNLPGMKVLLFAFGEGMADNPYILHHHRVNNIVYTGTHDNITVRGWYSKQASGADKQRLQKYTNRKVGKKNVHEVLIQLAMMSVAKLAVVPLQDVLGLGAEATMNKPSTGKGNWEWRVTQEQLDSNWEKRMRKFCEVYGR